MRKMSHKIDYKIFSYLSVSVSQLSISWFQRVYKQLEFHPEDTNEFTFDGNTWDKPAAMTQQQQQQQQDLSEE